MVFKGMRWVEIPPSEWAKPEEDTGPRMEPRALQKQDMGEEEKPSSWPRCEGEEGQILGELSVKEWGKGEPQVIQMWLGQKRWWLNIDSLI